MTTTSTMRKPAYATRSSLRKPPANVSIISSPWLWIDFSSSFSNGLSSSSSSTCLRRAARRSATSGVRVMGRLLGGDCIAVLMRCAEACGARGAGSRDHPHERRIDRSVLLAVRACARRVERPVAARDGFGGVGPALLQHEAGGGGRGGGGGGGGGGAAEPP